MDTLYSLENWLNEVKDMDCVFDVELIDKTSQVTQYGVIGNDELFIIVDNECLFIMDKKHLKSIVELLEDNDFINCYLITNMC